MIKVRKSAERGHSNIGWLDARFSFSFADYYDPAHMGFGPLRVINEDHIAGGAGFGEHGHADMEIVSYIVSGAMAHKDSMGNATIIRPGEIQRMTAGTGIRHAEMNPSRTEAIHSFQIWILPERRGLTPGYEQVTIAAPRPGGLDLIASRQRHDNAVVIHQDVDLYRATPGEGAPIILPVAAGRRVWVQTVRGDATINGVGLSAGDAAAITGETALAIAGDGELLVFDMA
ncbi:pirin family protein [Polymorphobacter sp. PAMC 29334]|uniref:pirin family protein n=1 Tax=Polymorphobacter sp. PAMC 29334 TaxID=2862331 RepID=UPI001C665CD5|nr:pirin family protein [Polymorphobacter sp. PAMC 29334]QYE34771.1 pirin family protein [Polymorphobacter sp. PAMC 29334]